MGFNSAFKGLIPAAVARTWRVRKQVTGTEDNV